MPRGASRTHGSSGENISHFGHIRLRVIGTGNLKPTYFSFQDVRSQALVPLPMSLTTNIEPLRLGNFNEQRASLELKTTNINDYFRINRILVYTKFFATEYPA